MSNDAWEAMTKHARTCVPGNRVYAYSAPHGTIYVNSVFKLVRVELGGVECPLEQLNRDQTDYVQNLILEAYENRDSLEEADVAI
ncbi:hypothetical protein BAE44_0001752 [Dichanthelium oligosanthes]|uniref:Calmodulin binding protein C-terminal domain-containing protein n=1 Tax=Dichanthelium oligosanthes TaxID=888268 RepID=A0A1E5WJC1_9POAL|nr:hypothetical protein BAE44_0001752 [Dichanthelium oligosanthes]